VNLGPPPEFGVDGSPPPFVSQYAIIADWNIHPFVPGLTLTDFEVPHHARYLQRWQRQDPTIQLPPGVSEATTVSLKIGMSTERADEIAGSFGVNGLHGLSATLSSKVTTKLSLSSERTVSKTVTLTNTSSDNYRRYAIWYMVHTILLYNNSEEQAGELLYYGRIGPRPDDETELLIDCGFSPPVTATLIKGAEFIASDATNISFIEIPPRASASR
jgi:hypothetical protein